MKVVVTILCLWLMVSVSIDAQNPPTLSSEIAQAIDEAINAKQIPGAVVFIANQDKVLDVHARGSQSLIPTVQPMSTNTIFDMASLTKPIATATCVMKLIEQDKLKLNDKAAYYLKNFGQHGKENITIEQLLLHTSGLIADNLQDDYEHGTAHAYGKIDGLKLVAPPGTRFIYSDVGYIVLGRIVEQLEGKPLDQVMEEWIAKPLQMHDTHFRRKDCKNEVLPRIAPTEKEGDTLFHGLVHDPRAQGLDGVAGHAGLFSTGLDTLKYAWMLMAGGKNILKPETVQLMTTPHFVPGGGMRSLGWDVDTSYSAPRGDHFPVGLSFGHTGFTGTSMWIDPTSQTIIVILTNRVHPDGKGNATPLRRNIASIVAKHLNKKPAPSPVKVGIDVLRQEGFKALENKRVALVTNHTGVARDGETTIDILHQAPKVKLTALFSPEHGIRGKLDEKVSDGKDEKTGLPIYSLYGDSRKPTKEQLKNIDIIVYDIQDIGCRFYTYISTLGLTLEAAAENNIPVIVLDRPNPLGGLAVRGPMRDEGKDSFVAYHQLPIQHGMTVGELAMLFNTERKLNAKLTVIKMKHWSRDQEFDKTGLVWVNPSPNMRTIQAALLYPGVGLLETTNLSVGRGTDRPFEIVGAPWIDATRWAQELKLQEVPGVRFVPLRFTPISSVLANKPCQGVSIVVDDWSKVNALQVGYTLAVTIRKLYPSDWQTKRLNTLLLHEDTWKAIEQGQGVDALLELSKKNLPEFLEVRKKYLLY
jgi:uncharacterized protein YbbC (DUF1343 family)/CubicO group peptidase (beta-lactamase class C family)